MSLREEVGGEEEGDNVEKGMEGGVGQKQREL